MIRVESLSVTRSGRRVLAGVNLQARRGELLAVLGPNGAGKSTLLRCMSGELAPSAGSVRFADEELARWPQDTLARHLAVLSQRTEVAFPFRVDELVELGRLPHGRARLAEVTELAMQRCGLIGLRHRDVTTLSGGEQQRTHLARVLCQLDTTEALAPRALLLDEPTSALDLSHQHEALSLAREAAASGVAVVAVLHDLNLASLYADRVAVLCDGALVASGPQHDVLAPELLREIFGVHVQRHVTPAGSTLCTTPARARAQPHSQHDLHLDASSGHVSRGVEPLRGRHVLASGDQER